VNSICIHTLHQNVWSGWPVYEVKCLCSRGRVATPTSISIFDSYDIKSLWFKFGHDIFTGFKMPRLRALHVRIIKYWECAILIPALWNISILLHKQAKWTKHFDNKCMKIFPNLALFSGILKSTSLLAITLGIHRYVH
jgi:hypothetical protein